MIEESQAVSALREVEKVSLRAMEISQREPGTNPKELLTALFLTVTDITRSVLNDIDTIHDAEIVTDDLQK